MSYPTPPVLRRPGTVSIGRAMIYWLALNQIITLILNIYLLSSVYSDERIRDVYESAGATPPLAKAAASTFFSTYYFSLGFAVVLGAAYGILAFSVGKGRQWARVTSWVVVGLFGICCGGIGVATNAAGPAAMSGIGGMSRNTGGIDQTVVAEKFLELVPDRATATLLILGIVSLLASITAVITLALPPSHPYFRQTPAWMPRAN